MKKAFTKIIAIVLVIMTIASVIPMSAGAMTVNGSSAFKNGKYGQRLAAVTLTGSQRTNIVNVAKSQVGYQEGGYAGTTRGSNNVTEYGRWYGMQDMWCAMFVSWCAYQAGISTSIVPKHAYTPSGLSWFKSRGLAYSRATVATGGYKPQPGDIIYFKSPRNSNPTNHIGIVTSYSGSTVYTVEGNTSSATVSTNGGAVASKSYAISNTYIVYICKPNYTGGAATNTGSSSTTTPAVEDPIPSAYKNWVFDADFYASKYKDLKDAFGYDATKLYNHFIENGMKEGRQASPLFDVQYYVNSSPDLVAAFGKDWKKAFTHFFDCGSKEDSRKYSAELEAMKPYIFDPVYYADKYADLKKAFGSDKGKLLDHFIVCGINEGRSASPYFEITTYINGNADLKSAFGKNNAKAFMHFARYYKNELRATSCIIDAQYYVGAYNDLAAIKTTTAAIDHFKTTGIAEGRRGSLEFNPTYYYTTYKSELAKYTANNCCLHYAQYGKAQGKSGSIEGLLSAAPLDIGTDFYAKIGYPIAGLNFSLSGDNVIIYGASSKPAQVWKFSRNSNGTYTIINMKSGKVLTVKDAKTDNSTPIVIAASTGNTNQQWNIRMLDGKYVLSPASAPTKVIDIPGSSTEALTQIAIYDYNGSNAQLFTFTKIDYLKSVEPADLGASFNARINYPKATNMNFSLSNTNVIIYPASTAPAQVWTFTKQADGSYEIKNTKNGMCLDVDGAADKDSANVQIYTDNNSAAQRWFIYTYAGGYVLRPSHSANKVIDVAAGGTASMTNVAIYTFNGSAAQTFTITKDGATQTTPPTTVDPGTSGGSTGGSSSVTTSLATPAQLAVLRKIMYAVETGGQVYGNAKYDDFTEAYTNTSNEHAITIGAGQWYATEAQRLLKLIRTKMGATKWAQYDTAGIGTDLDTKNWSTYKLSKTSAKAKCIQKILATAEGIAAQDQLIDEQMVKYLQEAKDLGVKNLDAQMMCANLRHLGGLSAVKRVLGKSSNYTLKGIYDALKTDTGNQVGTFRSRNDKVYNWLLTKLPAAS